MKSEYYAVVVAGLEGRSHDTLEDAIQSLEDTKRSWIRRLTFGGQLKNAEIIKVTTEVVYPTQQKSELE